MTGLLKRKLSNLGKAEGVIIYNNNNNKVVGMCKIACNVDYLNRFEKVFFLFSENPFFSLLGLYVTKHQNKFILLIADGSCDSWMENINRLLKLNNLH